MTLSQSNSLDTQLATLEAAIEYTEEELLQVWAKLARESYHDFYEYMVRDEGFVMSPHQRLIGDLLMSSASKETMRFLLSMPPGHCKSTHASHHFPAWWFGKNSKLKFLQAGHSQDFVANEIGIKVKQIIDSEDYRRVFPDVAIRQDMRAKDYWGLANGKGKYVAKGVGQGIAGFRGNYGMLDDPYKSRADAESPTIRDRAFKWFADDFSTRLLPGSPLGVIMCMVGDTQVTMADGTRKRLDLIEAGDRVMTWSNGVYADRLVTKVSNNGPDDVFEIVTQSGKLRANARHPFLIEREHGTEWVRLADIHKGDTIVSAGRDETRSATDYTADEAWALGFMFGDGWVTKNVKRNKDPRRPGERMNPTVSWVTCVADCPAYPDRVSRCIETLSAKTGAKFVFKTRERYFRTEKAALGRWLHGLGLGEGAKGKRIPAVIFQQTTTIREAFLEGFMAADGCVNRVKNYAVQQTLLSNRELVTDLRHLARGLGYRVTNICDSATYGRPPSASETKHWTNHGFKYHFEKAPVGPFTTSTVNTITPCGREDVFDITVEGDENFLADGHVSHNTRWHSDDICGRIVERQAREANESANVDLIEQDAELLNKNKECQNTPKEVDQMLDTIQDFDPSLARHKFEVINLPAICEDSDDPLGRAIGEPLWPELFDLAALENLKSDMVASSWNSLYQGTPMDVEGGAVSQSWFRRYKELPSKGDASKALPSEIRRVVVSVDAANTAKERSDFTVITVWIEHVNKTHYLADVSRGQYEFVKMSEEIARMCSKWARICGKVDALLVEARGNGLSYCQLKAEGGAPAPLIPIEVGPQSKEFRFDEVTPMFEAGMVNLPERALWLADYEKELVAFPHGKHDDQVDSTSQYLRWSRKSRRRGTKRLQGTAQGR